MKPLCNAIRILLPALLAALAPKAALAARARATASAQVIPAAQVASLDAEQLVASAGGEPGRLAPAPGESPCRVRVAQEGATVTILLEYD